LAASTGPSQIEVPQDDTEVDTEAEPMAEPSATLPAEDKPKAKPFVPQKSEAHNFLKQAALGYQDRACGRHPDDQPRPPGKLEPLPPGPASPNSAKVQEIRASQSEGALKPVVRKSYGGTVVGGKFIRNNVETVDDLSAADKQRVLDDLERRRAEQAALVADKAIVHKARKAREEKAKQDKFKAELSEAEAFEEQRKQKKAREMRKWLKAKEVQAKAKKEKNDKMVQELMDKEKDKQDQFKILEQKRLEEREKRLRIAEKQKAKLESQMLQRQERGAAPAALKGKADDIAKGDRVVHRHVHHHLHYHDSDGEGGFSSGGEGGDSFASPEERRQMERAIEARVKSQLNQPEGYYGPPGGSLPQIDGAAETPTMKRRAFSTGQLLNYDDAMRLSRTQQAFHRAPLPQLENYQRGLQQAMGSYANSGRPRRLAHAGGAH